MRCWCYVDGCLRSVAGPAGRCHVMGRKEREKRRKTEENQHGRGLYTTSLDDPRFGLAAGSLERRLDALFGAVRRDIVASCGQRRELAAAGNDVLMLDKARAPGQALHLNTSGGGAACGFVALSRIPAAEKGRSSCCECQQQKAGQAALPMATLGPSSSVQSQPHPSASCSSIDQGDIISPFPRSLALCDRSQDRHHDLLNVDRPS